METKQRLYDVERASRRATFTLMGFFLLLLGGSILCFWGWVTMLKAVL